MKVVLVKPGQLNVYWFEKHKGDVFNVIKKREDGYLIDTSRYGFNETEVFVSKEEVVEVVNPKLTSVKDDANTLETVAHYAYASGHRFGLGTLELVKDLLERIAKNGTNRIHRLTIAAAIHLNEMEKLEKQADYESTKFKDFVRDIRKVANAKEEE